jgi:hypothetical protein
MSVEALQEGLAKIEASATCHRAEFERERQRLDRLMVDVLRRPLTLRQPSKRSFGLTAS